MAVSLLSEVNPQKAVHGFMWTYSVGGQRESQWALREMGLDNAVMILCVLKKSQPTVPRIYHSWKGWKALWGIALTWNVESLLLPVLYFLGIFLISKHFFQGNSFWQLTSQTAISEHYLGHSHPHITKISSSYLTVSWSKPSFCWLANKILEG